MREKNRKPIASIKKLPQFTTMNVIDGQAGLVIYSSLIFYSLTIDNILNIIVLLILAGVTIATLMGDNGILTKATKAQSEQADATVKEAISLAWSEYQIIINEPTGEITENETKIASTTQVKIQGQEENYLATPSMSFWDFLKDEKGYIDENGVIDVETLTGETLSKGNGTDGVTDVYKIEEGEDSYILKYYGEDSEEETLWEVNVGNNGGSSSTYPEATPEDIFIYTETAEGIEITGVKRNGEQMGTSEWYKIKGEITDIVIPRTINGKPVVAITGFTFDWCEDLESITVPETVETIDSQSFLTNYSALVKIIFANGKNENLEIPENKWGAEYAQIIGKDGEILKE